MATEPPAPFYRRKLTGFVYFADIPEAVAENASKKPIEGRWPMLNGRRVSPSLIGGGLEIGVMT
jgi:hypothetical protein